VDVVFGANASPADTTPPSVSSISPVSGGSGIGVNTSVSAIFSEPLDPATITGSTFELRTSANAVVASTVSYVDATRTATLQPSAPLQNSATYTIRIKGGAAGVKDAAGNAMTADYVSSFTTGAAVQNTSPTQGPGGPILVVTDPSNPFGTYYAEILRAEGLNEFAAADLGTVDAGTLAAYDVVLLSQMALTSAQVNMFADYVTAGGNLIAMRPDKQFAGFLGLTDLGTTL